ncbi:MAG TPA: hypothetical protein PK413_11965 [Thermoanaerobaculia bacterium]|nr:hypothetical protein [Thermoanaerobaculia bacterium]
MPKQLPRFSPWALALLLAATAALGQEPGAESAPSRPADPRRTIVLTQLCRSEIAERELDLYASGTVRVREKSPDGEKLRLAELAPDELKSYLARLGAEDLSETDSSVAAPQGDWIERCELILSQPGRAQRSFEYDQFGSLSLALSRLVAIARELSSRALLEQRHLPANYTPHRGDILERQDGGRYRIVAFTVDKQGVELEGMDQPITLYVNLSQLGMEFAAVLAEKPE